MRPLYFFELIGQSPTQAQGYVFRSVELKQTAFRIDGVFLPPQDVPNPIAYFVEVQFQKDEQLFERETVVQICLQPREVEAVKEVAKLQGVDYLDLIREWVLEKVRTA